MAGFVILSCIFWFWGLGLAQIADFNFGPSYAFINENNLWPVIILYTAIALALVVYTSSFYSTKEEKNFSILAWILILGITSFITIFILPFGLMILNIR